MTAKFFRRKELPRARMPKTQNGQPGKRSFSYYSADKTPQPGRVERKRISGHTGLKRLRMIPTFIALAAIFLSIVYSTTLTTTPKVLFAGDSSPYRSAAEYQKLASKILQRSLLSRSKLTINTDRVNENMLTEAPELDAAKLVLPIIGRRPTITLHARVPSLILTTKTNAFILDSTGKAVSDTRQLPSSTREGLLTLQDESGLELRIGDQALTSETVNFILNVQSQLSDKKLTINRLSLPATPNEVDIYIEGLKYFIKADVSGDVRLQMGTFLATKDKLGSKAPGEYMDVRVEEKVFYK